MRRSIFGGDPDRGNPDALRERLDAARVAGDWPAVLATVRLLLPLDPTDVRLPVLGAEAILRHQAEPGVRAVAEAAAWLKRALDLAPGNVDTLYLLGLFHRHRGEPAEAEGWWQRAATADPDDPRVRGALVSLWGDRGQLPAWGVSLLETTLLDHHDPTGWRLLLDHWLTGAELTAAGLRLAQRRFHQHRDDDPRLATVLTREMLRYERYDELSRQVFVSRAAHDPAAARGVVRCDARARGAQTAALPWYLDAVADGDIEAGLLVTQGILAGWLPLDAATAPAVRLAVELAEAADWHSFRLDRQAALDRLAAWLVERRPTADALPLVAAVAQAHQAEPRWLDWLAGAHFAAGDFAAAHEVLDALLALTPVDAEARLKRDLCQTRLALRQGTAPATAPADPRLAVLLAAAFGQPIDHAAWHQAVLAGEPTPAVSAAVARVAGAAGDLPAVAQPGDGWLVALLGGAHDEPAAALWRRYLAARESDDAAAWLPFARRGDPPWGSVRLVALDRLARGTAPATLEPFEKLLTPDQRRIVELRRAAEAIDHGDLGATSTVAALAPTLAPERAAWLMALARLAVAATHLRAGRPDEALAALAAPAPATLEDRRRWLRCLAAPDRETVEALPPELRQQPAIAWALSRRWAAGAGELLAAALRQHRERDDLRLGLARLAAEAGQLDRCRTWLEPLRGRDAATDRRLALVEAGLTAPLTALEPAPDDPDEVALAVAAAWLTAGEPARAAEALAGRAAPETLNLRALAVARAGRLAECRTWLASLPDSPAAWHNRAVAAEADGDLATAAAQREQELAVLDASPAVRYEAHRLLATQWHRLHEPAAELRHLDVCLALRPDEPWLLRASLAPLLDTGEGAEAERRSTRLLAAEPSVQVQIEHAAVLAAVRGAGDAAQWLDSVAAAHPEAGDAVAEQRAALADQLAAGLRERQAGKDWLGLFALGRDAEQAARDDEERGRALLHQAVALGNLAGGDDGPARLEQARARCAQALALDLSAGLREQATRLQQQAGHRLAPHLLRQAAGLLMRRRRDWERLAAREQDPPRQAGRLALRLAEAFDRVDALLAEAAAVGDAPAAAQASERRPGAQALSAAAREFAARQGEAPHA